MAKSSSTRQKILEAAFQIFSSKGYVGTTTREIAQQAEVAEVTLFRHFTNKATLLTELVRSYSSIPILAELMPELQCMPYKNAVELLAIKFIEHLDVNWKWIQIVNREMQQAPETERYQYTLLINELFDILSVFFKQAQQRGDVRVDIKPEHMARGFHCMMYGFYHVETMFDASSGLTQERRNLLDSFILLFCNSSKNNLD